VLLPLLVGHSPENIESFSELGCKWMLRNSTNLNSAEHILVNIYFDDTHSVEFLWCTSLVLEWVHLISGESCGTTREAERHSWVCVGIPVFRFLRDNETLGTKTKTDRGRNMRRLYSLAFCWCFLLLLKYPFLLVKMHGHISWVMEQSLHMQHLIAAGFVWK